MTPEVLVGLDFLPREEFLGPILQSAHGANEARSKLAAEAEELRMHFLPGDLRLGSDKHKGQLYVQPDAVFRPPVPTRWSKPNEYDMEAFSRSNSLVNM